MSEKHRWVTTTLLRWKQRVVQLPPPAPQNTKTAIQVLEQYWIDLNTGIGPGPQTLESYHGEWRDVPIAEGE